MIAAKPLGDPMGKKKPTQPPPPEQPPVIPEADEPTSESVRIARDLLEMAREICFHTKDQKGRRLKVAQLLDNLLRPALTREYEAFKQRQQDD